MVRSILITVLTIILIVESSTEPVANEGDSDRSKENEHDVKNKKRITILNIEDLLNLEKSDIFGLGNIHGTNDIPRDMIDDGINSNPLSPGLYSYFSNCSYVSYDIMCTKLFIYLIHM